MWCISVKILYTANNIAVSLDYILKHEQYSHNAKLEQSYFYTFPCACGYSVFISLHLPEISFIKKEKGMLLYKKMIYPDD